MSAIPSERSKIDTLSTTCHPPDLSSSLSKEAFTSPALDGGANSFQVQYDRIPLKASSDLIIYGWLTLSDEPYTIEF